MGGPIEVTTIPRIRRRVLSDTKANLDALTGLRDQDLGYATDTTLLYRQDGDGAANWVAITSIFSNPLSVMVKAANEDVTSSDVLQNDNDLLIPVAANEVWAFLLMARLDSEGIAADHKISFACPAAGTVEWYTLDEVLAATEPYLHAKIEGETTILLNARRSSAGEVLVPIFGVYVGAGNAGNVNFQWCQNTSDPTWVRVMAGSYMLAWKVN